MISVNTHEAKTRLSELLGQVEKKGEVVRICRAGKPVAELRQLAAGAGRLQEPHPVFGRIKVKGDLTEPLDDANLPEDLKDWNPDGPA